MPAKKFKTIGVLGAGFMGAGIAYVSALAGLDVVLVDRDPETAQKGKNHSQKIMTKQVSRGRATTRHRQRGAVLDTARDWYLRTRSKPAAGHKRDRRR